MIQNVHFRYGLVWPKNFFAYYCYSKIYQTTKFDMGFKKKLQSNLIKVSFAYKN